nr:MAG TPA: hypothetical protein [Caudoviricetes sp.]
MWAPPTSSMTWEKTNHQDLSFTTQSPIQLNPSLIIR